ncbi:hypothetical protein PaecuDRAFT_0908 [Paenibacillus curdlanolyticus YK9]|uniref:Uncharacterized protein n=1 Tax=Paenibacillus curdlanolyticus YK9 TaxID=717606 RepID=E0I5I6_9BACL|nr:hypothetical protein [Paenibacillus curdlanolyticus]EFM12228.1 hypothetical protein PaecuDRAFT_0908 [Paenibacillus curdlanolyticus YK9]
MESAAQEMGAFTGTIEEQRRQFGIILGLNGPVSEEVLFAAVHDPSYAHNLLSARRSEMFLTYLLNNPPIVQQVGGGEAIGALGAAQAANAAIPEGTDMASAAGGTTASHSNMELAKKAGQALWKWARAGFATVEDDVYRKRMSACATCPHIQSKPNKLLYNALTATSSAADDSAEKICGKCGCVLSKKTKLPSESCPDNHPELAGMTRWEEPIPTSSL